MPAAGTTRLPVLAPAMMFPPGAAPAPIVEVAITQRIAVAVIVEHPHAIAGIIIIVVPAAAKADVDETAAIIRRVVTVVAIAVVIRSEEHPSEFQSLMRISYASFCLNKKKYQYNT